MPLPGVFANNAEDKVRAAAAEAMQPQAAIAASQYPSVVLRIPYSRVPA